MLLSIKAPSAPAHAPSAALRKAGRPAKYRRRRRGSETHRRRVGRWPGLMLGGVGIAPAKMAIIARNRQGIGSAPGMAARLKLALKPRAAGRPASSAKYRQYKEMK